MDCCNKHGICYIKKLIHVGVMNDAEYIKAELHNEVLPVNLNKMLNSKLFPSK